MSGGYDAQHYQVTSEVEDRHFWFRARNAALSVVASQIADQLPPEPKILEVGCGTGNTLRVLEKACPGGTLVGIDLLGEGLRYAQHRTSALLARGRIDQLPFRTKFDLVGLFDVLEHVEDDREALVHLHRVLKPGGALLLTVPAHPHLWSAFDEESHHCRRYTPACLQARILGAGFQIEYLTQFMASTYPLVLASRRVRDIACLVRKNPPPPHAVAEDLRIRPVINGVLTSLLTREAWLLRRRWRLPIGTSLLVAART